MNANLKADANFSAENIQQKNTVKPIAARHSLEWRAPEKPSWIAKSQAASKGVK